MGVWQVLSEVYVTVKSLFRYRDALFWVIVFPILVTVLMIGIFARGSGDVSFTLGVESRDGGWVNETIYEVLGSTGMFEIGTVEGGLAEAVSNGTFDVGLLIPEGVSSNLSSGRQGYVIVYYVEGDRASETASTVLESVLTAFSRNVSMRGVEIASSLVPGVEGWLRFLAEPLTVEREAIEPEVLATVGGLRAYYAFSIIGIQALYAGVFSSISMVIDRRREGVFSVILSSPIRGSTLFASDTLAVILLLLLSSGVILATALAMGADYSAFALEEALVSVALIVAGGLSMIGIGLLVAGVARSQEGAMALANMVTFPMMFIGGLAVPRFILPESLQLVSEVFPLSRLVEAVRRIAVYGYTPGEALAYAAPGLVAGLALYLVGALVYRRLLEAAAERP